MGKYFDIAKKWNNKDISEKDKEDFTKFMKENTNALIYGVGKYANKEYKKHIIIGIRTVDWASNYIHKTYVIDTNDELTIYDPYCEYWG